MTFHAETIDRLAGSLQKYRAELREATVDVKRRQVELLQAQAYFDEATSKVDTLTEIVADCVRFLDFAELCDRDNDLAHAFANAVLDRDAEVDAERDRTEAALLSGTPLTDALRAAIPPRLMCVRCGIGDRDTEDGLCRHCVNDEDGAR